MKLDAFYFVQGLRRQVALTTVRATDGRHVLNDKQARPLAVTARDAANLGPFFAADIT